jgi:NDP-sugar pyrophosphorylase family protein
LQAVLLAAGRGKRLSPLTDYLPKPLLPVCNVPLIEHSLDALANIGVETVFINLHHAAEQLRRHLACLSYPGMEIVARRESRLSGPAGALRLFKDVIDADDALLVLSGDALHDIPLDAFYEFHRRGSAPLSVVMKRVANPGRYGVATVDPDGSLTSFTEKPALRPDTTALVSCGIYCVDSEYVGSIPPGYCDFGADLIPQRVVAREPVGVFETEAYWADIGDFATFRDANLAAAEGLVSLRLATQDRPNTKGSAHNSPSSIVVARDAAVAPDAQLVGPVVVGHDAQVGRRAYVSRSVVMPHARIPQGALIVGAVVGVTT